MTARVPGTNISRVQCAWEGGGGEEEAVVSTVVGFSAGEKEGQAVERPVVEKRVHHPASVTEE
jgi:hypothetical protein